MLAVISNEQFWTCFLTGIFGIATILCTQFFQIYTIKLNARLAEKGRQTINENIAQNTAITKNAVNNIQTIAGQRMALALGRKPAINHKPEFFEIALPGVDYETFGLSTGEKVEWRSEACENGRKVRFLVSGPAEIGFHFHLHVEVNSSVRGTLIYETSDKVVHLQPGEHYSCEADEIHKASFEGPGEATCFWPELESDTLTIGFFPQ